MDYRNPHRPLLDSTGLEEAKKLSSPATHWGMLRSHGSSDELAGRAKDYIRRLLGEPPPRPPGR